MQLSNLYYLPTYYCVFNESCWFEIYQPNASSKKYTYFSSILSLYNKRQIIFYKLIL